MRERDERVLADLVRLRAEEKPDLDVLTFEHWSLDGGATPDEVRTYADLAERSDALAAAMIARGMERGDRFAVVARNHPEFVEALVAASITGTIAVPIDPRTKGEKLAFYLQNARCKGVICGDYCVSQVEEVRGSLADLEWVWVIPPDSEEGRDRAERSWTTWLDEVTSDVPPGTVDVRLESARDPLQIIFTSGTTGDPKGVVFRNERFGLFALAGLLFGYQPDERPYTGLSLTHGNAQAVTFAPSLNMGLRAVFSRRFTKSRLWDVCRRYGCTTFSLLGGMATAIYSEPERPDDSDNPVRVVISAGMPPAIWESFERRFGVKILEWYGAIEGGLAIKPVGQGPVGSFGKPVPGLEMAILDENDRPCPPGVIGEICSRPAGGGSAEVEYLDNPEASAAKTRGGWLRSGDMGHVDEEGWFFFDYRKGGGIRHNGEFISPSFIEKVVAEDPQVDDVFAYGVPPESGAPGEKDVVVAVVPTDPANFDPRALFERCKRELEPNFVPSYVQVVDEIPKTASEKPQERFLAEAFAPDAPNVYAAE